jgi:pimeloyl-ACP methyl ester carboxylesterase
VATSPAKPLPLLLLPASLCDRALWRHQIEALESRVEIHLGDLTQDDSIAAMAARVLSTAPGCFAVAGLSMGAYVALELVRQAPGRVRKLALLGATARPDAPAEGSRRRDLLALREQRAFRGITPPLMALLIHPERLADTAFTKEIEAMALRIGKAAFLRQLRAIVERPDSRPLLPSISCPTLIVAGREDALAPLAEQEALADAIPGARLEVLERCGHLAPLERPEAVAAILAAWLDLPPGGAFEKFIMT